MELDALDLFLYPKPEGGLGFKVGQRLKLRAECLSVG